MTGRKEGRTDFKTLSKTDLHINVDLLMKYYGDIYGKKVIYFFFVRFILVVYTELLFHLRRVLTKGFILYILVNLLTYDHSN